jgi:hypothetical protein
MENYYDYELGDWVTDASRFAAVADQPRFALLRDYEGTPEQRWPLILELLEAVPEDTVHLVGSGPLDFFLGTSGEQFVEQLEAAARESERFRRAVLEVYLEAGRLPPEVEARLVAAFGPRFRLEPPPEPST